MLALDETVTASSSAAALHDAGCEGTGGGDETAALVAVDVAVEAGDGVAISVDTGVAVTDRVAGGVPDGVAIEVGVVLGAAAHPAKTIVVKAIDAIDIFIDRAYGGDYVTG